MSTDFGGSNKACKANAYRLGTTNPIHSKRRFTECYNWARNELWNITHDQDKVACHEVYCWYKYGTPCSAYRDSAGRAYWSGNCIDEDQDAAIAAAKAAAADVARNKPPACPPGQHPVRMPIGPTPWICVPDEPIRTGPAPTRAGGFTVSRGAFSPQTASLSPRFSLRGMGTSPDGIGTVETPLSRITSGLTESRLVDAAIGAALGYFVAPSSSAKLGWAAGGAAATLLAGLLGLGGVAVAAVVVRSPERA